MVDDRPPTNACGPEFMPMSHNKKGTRCSHKPAYVVCNCAVLRSLQNDLF